MDSQSRTEVAVAVVLHDGNVLIGPRPAGGPLAGYWEFPGGKLAPGELPAEAAARECLEETGLRLASWLPWETVNFDYAHGRLRLYFLQGQLKELSTVGPLPTAKPPFRWVPFIDLPRYSFPPANRGVLAQLAAGVSPAKTV